MRESTADRGSPGPASTGIRWGTVDAFRGNTTSPILAAYRPCPLCGDIRWQTVVPFRDVQFYSDSDVLPKRHSFDVCLCRGCLTLFTNPCLTPYGFRILADEAGRSYDVSAGRFDEQIRWMGERHLLRTGTTVLDVGCSDGAFLLKLPETIRRIGVDIDQPSIDRALAARGTANAAFHAMDFERFQLGEAVDVITMFHVLEHLPAPRVVLEHLRAISNPTTRLLVEVPIVELGATSDINGFLSVYHLTHFSRSSLEAILGISGWQVVETEIQGDHNGCRVIAVPGPPREARSPSIGDRGHLYRYLSSWYGALENVEAKLIALADHDSIAIWGAGIHLEFLYQFTSLFRDNDARRYVVVDSDQRKQGKTWRGIPVQSPDVLSALDWRSVALIVSTYGGQDSVVAAAKERGVPEAAIVTLYESIRHR